jgi:hypothetical protein
MNNITLTPVAEKFLLCLKRLDQIEQEFVDAHIMIASEKNDDDSNPVEWSESLFKKQFSDKLNDIYLTISKDLVFNLLGHDNE